MFNMLEYNTQPYQPTWILVWLVISIMIVGYVYSAYQGRFFELLRSFITPRFAAQLSREEYSLSNPASILLSLNFLTNTALFLSLSLRKYHIDLSFGDLNLAGTLLLLLGLATVYFIKIATIKVISGIFEGKLLANDYIFILFLVAQVIGIAFLPLNILLAYADESYSEFFIQAGQILLLFMIIIRVGKGVLSALSHRELTPLYLFLYLCTLEILPLFIGYKLLVHLI